MVSNSEDKKTFQPRVVLIVDTARSDEAGCETVGHLLVTSVDKASEREGTVGLDAA